MTHGKPRKHHRNSTEDARESTKRPSGPALLGPRVSAAACTVFKAVYAVCATFAAACVAFTAVCAPVAAAFAVAVACVPVDAPVSGCLLLLLLVFV